MLLAVDAMGGDNAPLEICRGAIQACNKHTGLAVVLVGNINELDPILEKEASVPRDRVHVLHAEESIAMDEHPTIAIRKKRRSSLRIAMEMVRSGEAKGLVSAGNTGAIVAGGVLVVGRIHGLDRPGFGVALPTLHKPTFLLDVGATVRSKPINLYQFALMGNVYMKTMLGVKTPKVALLSNGSEEIKGDDVVAEARELLSRSTLNFSGYVEGDDIPYSRADVIVCDGFSGNMVLKFAEGLMHAVYEIVEEELHHRLFAKMGMLFMIPMMKTLWRRFNYERYGGTPLLGVNGAVVKAHGRSKAAAIASALSVTMDFVEKNGVALIREELGQENS